MADIKAIAADLAKSRHRFLTDIQIGAIRRKHGASRDEVRSAAIMADRIRRQRQIQERHNGFTVIPQIALDEPIVLRDEYRPATRRRQRKALPP